VRRSRLTCDICFELEGANQPACVSAYIIQWAAAAPCAHGLSTAAVQGSPTYSSLHDTSVVCTATPLAGSCPLSQALPYQCALTVHNRRALILRKLRELSLIGMAGPIGKDDHTSPAKIAHDTPAAIYDFELIYLSNKPFVHIAATKNLHGRLSRL